MLGGKDQRFHDLPSQRTCHYSFLCRNGRHGATMQKRASNVEKLLILGSGFKTAQQPGDTASHLVSSTQFLVPIRRNTEILLIVGAQAKGCFDCRDVRQKLVNTLRQECADYEVADGRFEENRLLRLLDNRPAALVPIQQLGCDSVFEAQCNRPLNLNRSSIAIVVDVRFPAQCIRRRRYFTVNENVSVDAIDPRNAETTPVDLGHR